MSELELLAAGHRVGRRSRRGFDVALLAAVGVLLIVGLVAVYTASFRIAVASEITHQDGNYFLKRQIAWVLIGLAAMVVTAVIDYRQWRALAPWIMAAALLVLVGILLFGELRFGGFRRWLAAGGSVQPSEAVKLAMITYVAAWLAGKGDDIHDVTLGLLPFAVLVGTVCGLIVLQPDLSTAALIALIAATMFFVAGAEMRQILAAAALAGLTFVFLVLQTPYRLNRIRGFLHPEMDPANLTFQVHQSQISIIRGGLSGVGLGQGQEKHLLPAPHTDTVFAVIGEEAGVAGCLVVVGLLAVILWRGMVIAASSQDPFAAYVALGVVCWIGYQALINMCGVTGLIPLTGMPLPFVSFGGSSMIACLSSIGILLNISRTADRHWVPNHADLSIGRWHRRSRLSRAYRARRLAV